MSEVGALTLLGASAFGPTCETNGSPAVLGEGSAQLSGGVVSVPRRQSIDPAATVTPVVLPPGASATLPVVITPGAAGGTVVSGRLFVDTETR